MIGHKGLPLANSLFGLLLWVGLGLWLVPLYGAYGMALAVSAAVVATALLAVAELAISDRLSPFTSGFWRSALAAGLFVAALWLAGDVLNAFGQPARAIALLILFWPLLWLALRFGLEPSDKAALGKLAVRLRL
jgi:O-antigen/teichoic acid export membrane protein